MHVKELTKLQVCVSCQPCLLLVVPERMTGFAVPVCCRFKDHPILNERYLLLCLLGKGGFSEVHKVSVGRC